MKCGRNIWILIVIYLACSARTCTEDEESLKTREEKVTGELRDSVESVFTADTLNDDLLKAYEITAIAKLMDFSDYLRIVSDTTLSIEFRKHAADLIRDIFISGDVNTQSLGNCIDKININTLDLLIGHALSEGFPEWILPDKNYVITPLVNINDSVYKGTIAFDLNLRWSEEDRAKKISHYRLCIEFHLLKRPKFFGSEELMVWDIYLGDISSCKNR